MSLPYCPRMLRFLMIIALIGLMKPAYAQSQNDDWKTLAIFSMTSTDEGAPLIKQLLTAAGHDGVLDEFEQQQREAFQTLDFSQPKGVVWQTNGRTFRFLGFMAMSDMTELPYGLGETIADSETMSNGWAKIPVPNSEQLPVMFKNVYVKQQGDWGWFCYGILQPPKELPNDPVALLEGLPEEFPVALRLQCANMPRSLLNGYATIGKQFIPMIKLFLPQSGGDEEQKMMAAWFNYLETVLPLMIDQTVKFVNETETITFGLTGNDENDVFLSMQLVAKPGTDTANAIKMCDEGTTEFGGFFQPDKSSVAYAYSAQIPDYQKKFLKETSVATIDCVDGLMKIVKAQAEESAPDGVVEAFEAIEALLAQLPVVVDKTVDAGKCSIATSQIYGDSPYPISISAMKISGGNELVKPLDEFSDIVISAIEQEMGDIDDSVTRMLEKENYKSFQLWSISVALPSFFREFMFADVEEEDIPEFMMVGVFGLSDNAIVYGQQSFSNAGDVMNTLKAAIDESGKPEPMPEEWMVVQPHYIAKAFRQFQTLDDEDEEGDESLDIPKDARIVVTQKIEENAMTQTLTIDGKLWPVIGVAVERIIEENGGMPF